MKYLTSLCFAFLVLPSLSAAQLESPRRTTDWLVNQLIEAESIEQKNAAIALSNFALSAQQEKRIERSFVFVEGRSSKLAYLYVLAKRTQAPIHVQSFIEIASANIEEITQNDTAWVLPYHPFLEYLAELAYFDDLALAALLIHINRFDGASLELVSTTLKDMNIRQQKRVQRLGESLNLPKELLQRVEK
ncbi:hypothetical protein [Vibrio sp. 10N]|uniref:hypothetical protein n=1 Tax=Vibrio sp. 10N TaxID=3058938 RepID=UPI002813F6CA|nr:hypothetical protein VB10N_01850 [Vibrio sp. 10N]